MKWIKTGWPAILWAIFIFILSVIPGSEFPKRLFIPHIDKVAHFIFYAVFVVLLMGAKWEEIKLIQVVIICFLYGLLIELIQHYLIPNRSFGLDDIMANTLGIVFGLTINRWVLKF